MTRTNRNKRSWWYSKEDTRIRRAYNKSIRLKNKYNLKTDREIEKPLKTKGWLTW